MEILEAIKKFFGIGSRTQKDISKPDLKYADPSHATLNKRIKDGTYSKSKIVPQKSKRPQKKSNHSHRKINFSPEKIEKFIIIYLKKSEYKNGVTHKQMTNYVWACVKGNLWKRPPTFKSAMQKALKKLQTENKIGFNKNKRVWKIKPKVQKVALCKLTTKEKAYFKHQNLGEGWYRLNDNKTGRDAIKWLHQNYNWQEFEQFCCNILTHVGIKDAKLSEKDPLTGADGGIDGYGSLLLNGEYVPITIQAKRYDPNHKLGVKDVRDFVSATIAKNVIHGFLVCTCDLTPDAKQHITNINTGNATKAQFEVIDQTRLIECMIHRANSIHGYGLHKTDDLGIYYLNPSMLKNESPSK